MQNNVLSIGSEVAKIWVCGKVSWQKQGGRVNQMAAGGKSDKVCGREFY